MPRSGTTLIEQILSSHSLVNGAGELNFVEYYGHELAHGFMEPNSKSISEFREKYLTELKKFSNGKLYVTDKMPHNFRYFALISAAFPEAKIIHVTREAAALCWSNYRQYFLSKGLSLLRPRGYS